MDYKYVMIEMVMTGSLQQWYDGALAVLKTPGQLRNSNIPIEIETCFTFIIFIQSLCTVQLIEKGI